jgi:hypothetical protein
LRLGKAFCTYEFKVPFVVARLTNMFPSLAFVTAKSSCYEKKQKNHIWKRWDKNQLTPLTRLAAMAFVGLSLMNDPSTTGTHWKIPENSAVAMLTLTV